MRVGAVMAWVAAGCALFVSGAARAENPDVVLSQFFSIWDNNAQVTPERVQDLYAHYVRYYGEYLSNGQVYANKRAFIRRWPDRHYAVVPGTVRKGCDRGMTRCAVTVTLAYRAASQARDAAAGGYTQVSLDLAREDGEWKIVHESGHRVSRPD